MDLNLHIPGLLAFPVMYLTISFDCSYLPSSPTCPSLAEEEFLPILSSHLFFLFLQLLCKEQKHSIFWSTFTQENQF